MAVVKIYCSRCGQRVSGDESFYGTTVHCPVCSSEIHFPDAPDGASAPPAAGTTMVVPPPPGPQPGMPGGMVFPPSRLFSGGGVTTPMPRHPDQPVVLPAPGSGPFPAAAGAHGLPVGPLADRGAGPAGKETVPAAPPAPSIPSPGSGHAAEAKDAGPLPVLVLASGIASLATCSGFLVLAAVAIIGGHLTMMKLHQAGIQDGRGKVLTGTLLGYGSVVLFLLVAIAAKLAWPAIQKLLHGG